MDSFVEKEKSKNSVESSDVVQKPNSGQFEELSMSLSLVRLVIWLSL